ncbi:MAG: aspartate-semialdehyde dehydrogenase [Bdellovibrionales bacterium]|nr:aspartate-semialdehyde dehydrogenase [Bdellovibrionales bacterium]
MATKQLKMGVVGATGMVGTEFLKMLQERQIPISELRLFASERSSGKTLKYRDQDIELQALRDGCFTGLDVVFFSAGGPISKIWAPKAVEEGAYAIDNSSVFRMNKEIDLVVPEVNGDLLHKYTGPKLIANPNCSTIQLMLALAPLQKKFGLASVKVATYQSVSGAGIEAVDELKNQTRAYLQNEEVKPQIFSESIAYNNLPLIGEVETSGYTNEEEKMIHEANKILRQEDLKLSSFCVRTSTINGHSEAVWVELNKTIEKEEFVKCLKSAPGVVVSDSFTTNRTADGKDPVYIGRIHRDFYDSKTWLFWCVSDNIRKGAALNGIQIAEMIFDISQH